ncbi:MAG: antibiotic biosynthesis monooxygenase [Acidobacteriota bacterium]
MAFLALSRFKVANGMSEAVRSAFAARPHMVDDAPGFLRMDVVRPVEDPDEYWLLTYWSDEASFRSWHQSHLYRQSHAGIPSGLKLDARATELRFFETIAE